MFVNNEKAFAIDPAQYIDLHLRPGQYVFKLKSGGGLCPNVVITKSATLENGSHLVYRILLPSDGALRIVREQ